MNKRTEIILGLIGNLDQKDFRSIIDKVWPSRVQLNQMTNDDFDKLVTKIENKLKELKNEKVNSNDSDPTRM